MMRCEEKKNYKENLKAYKYALFLRVCVLYNRTKV